MSKLHSLLGDAITGLLTTVKDSHLLPNKENVSNHITFNVGAVNALYSIHFIP